MFRIPFACALLLLAPAGGAEMPTPNAGAARSYPPSCLSLPLPQTPSGPSVVAYGTLPTINGAQEYPGTEPVKFTFWRVPCASGSAALLLQVARTGDTSINAVEWFTDPGLIVTQDGVRAFARLALEPNTLYSSVKFDTVIPAAATFVFENTNPGDLTQLQSPTAFDFRRAFTVVIPNVAAIGIDPPPPAIVASIPAYDATQYADAALPLPITGYQSGNYADPDAGAQGVQVEVGETPDGARTLLLAWYTYDAGGAPTWLFNSIPFAAGARSVDLPLAYFHGGAFGSGNGAATHWGTVTVAFPDCDHLALRYAAVAGLPNGIPQGSGNKTFVRQTSIGNLACR